MQMVKKYVTDSIHFWTFQINQFGNYFAVQLCRPTTLKNEDERSVECDTIVKSINQTLWPDHCVNGTEEANFADGLFIDPLKDKVVFKGTNPMVNGAWTINCLNIWYFSSPKLDWFILCILWQWSAITNWVTQFPPIRKHPGVVCGWSCYRFLCSIYCGWWCPSW